jgi:hypothetical protein
MGEQRARRPHYLESQSAVVSRSLRTRRKERTDTSRSVRQLWATNGLLFDPQGRVRNGIQEPPTRWSRSPRNPSSLCAIHAKAPYIPHVDAAYAMAAPMAP